MRPICRIYSTEVFFLTYAASTGIYTLSLHDALPISSLHRRESRARLRRGARARAPDADPRAESARRSEEHTSELQSRVDIVCRLLLEKKKHKTNITKILTQNIGIIIKRL